MYQCVECAEKFVAEAGAAKAKALVKSSDRKILAQDAQLEALAAEQVKRMKGQ